MVTEQPSATRRFAIATIGIKCPRPPPSSQAIKTRMRITHDFATCQSGDRQVIRRKKNFCEVLMRLLDSAPESVV